MHTIHDPALELDELDVAELGTWDTRAPAHHGGGYVAPGRRVLQIHDHIWAAQPETCTAAIRDTTWYLDGRLLLCNLCGLDGT
ncbi:hypothetical protein AB0C65_38640 [Nocardia sp. NPDC048505]|uniref:hypothetical protein n=1 Tax=Nocardia sp. NPDC048505 TaxID=3155756 RepID=UPI0033EBBBC0